MGNRLPFRHSPRFGWTRPPPGIMTMAVLGAALAAVLVLLACTPSGEKVPLLITVGSELEDCEGVAQTKCLVVNGELFYNMIEGFDYEEGFVYRLRIEREDLYPGDEEPPQDASRYHYRLIEVVSKTQSLRSQ